MPIQRVDIKSSQPVIAKALSGKTFDPIVIMRGRKPIAAVLPLDGGDYESIALSLNPEFRAMIERSRRSIEEDGGIPFEEIERRFGLSSDQPNRGA